MIFSPLVTSMVAPWTPGMRIPLYFSVILALVNPLHGAGLTETEKLLAAGHPRADYTAVENIDAMAAALRKELSQRQRYSFSRGWWMWDRLRARYVDEGRRNTNELKILQAAFRALILDWHARLEARGEGDRMFIFFVTNAPGSKTERELPDGTVLIRDLHGGGYHGGWGGAARMRIYEELANRGMLTPEEKDRFKRIVYQSMSRRFLDFTKGSQHADNHSYGNGGGVAMALKLFPEAPQAREARAWIDRIWSHMSEFGDWTEWNYFPYGPIFLHGMIDIAEGMDWLEKESEIIHVVGSRVLGFVHGGGLRGGPNCGSPTFRDRKALEADPWNLGNYRVETPARDGHFWYRMAQHYRNAHYLWAAEQSVLGGNSPGKETNSYRAARHKRFAWFDEAGIQALRPEGGARIGLLSARRYKIPERLYLEADRRVGTPFASFFLYPTKDSHLDSLSGQLYEYVAHGAKFLHSSGKYSMLDRGGGSGEESLDVLLVMHKQNPFPLHPDKAENGDFIRKGAIELMPELLVAENNESGDSYGQFGWKNYYGRGSKWIRRTVLSREGFLVVADEYTPAQSMGSEYHAGPVWHLALEDGQEYGVRQQPWFDAPAFDHAWWQSSKWRVRLVHHQQKKLVVGSSRLPTSQDLDPNMTTYAYKPVHGGETARFLSVFVPHHEKSPQPAIGNTITPRGASRVEIELTSIEIGPEGSWKVLRRKADRNQ